jgi:hypothetical protein
MPIRVKSRPLSQPEGLRTPSPMIELYGDLPEIEDDDSFRDVIKKLSVYVFSLS